MPKIKKTENKDIENDIGYTCEVCGKTVLFQFKFLPQFNTITWSFPSGNGGQFTTTETIYICSLECMLKALKKVYFGAYIELSHDFLESIRDIKNEF